VFLVVAAAAWPLPGSSATGQGHSSSKADQQTLTNSAGIFQIKYSQDLVRCEHLDAENPDVWSPQEACVASIPVCDSSGHAGNVLACLAYRATEFHGSEMQAAAFAVSSLDSFRTEKDCMQKWTADGISDVHAEQIRGVKFQAGKMVETQGSYVAEHLISRTFHKNACYELDVNISTALDTAFAAEDMPRKLSPAERDKIKATLAHAMEGFAFLK
jgi:hypothetical protein